MADFPFLTPKEHVFHVLRSIQHMAATESDLNGKRDVILTATERAISWEGEIREAVEGSR